MTQGFWDLRTFQTYLQLNPQSSLLPCRLILLNPKFKFDFACDATTFLYYVTKGKLPKKEKIIWASCESVWSFLNPFVKYLTTKMPEKGFSKIRMGFPNFQIILFLFFSLPCGKRNNYPVLRVHQFFKIISLSRHFILLRLLWWTKCLSIHFLGNTHWLKGVQIYLLWPKQTPFQKRKKVIKISMKQN